MRDVAEGWRTLLGGVVKEQDPEKRLELSAESNHVLEAKERHLNNVESNRINFDDLTAQVRPPHNYGAGSPYCSDPNCEYCAELRRTHEDQTQVEQSSSHSATVSELIKDSW
jgi:hypothetical protein